MFKIINMHRGETSRIAADTDEALDAIKANGLYVKGSGG